MILIEYRVNEGYDYLGGIHSIFRAISAGQLPGHTLIFALGFYCFSPKNRAIPGIHVFVYVCTPFSLYKYLYFR